MPNPNQTINLDIQNRLSSVDLPTVPQVLVKLMELCQSTNINLPELVDLIACDVALTTKILKQANSPLYKHNNKQANLLQSIQILGMDMIKLICISESVYHVFGVFSQIDDSTLDGFWKHSVLTAVSARLIAKKMNYHSIEEAYLAGLLHDVGRLALLSSEPSIIDFFAKDNDLLCALERKMFKFTHAEASAWIIGQWNFDSSLSDSALYHHEKTTRLENTHPLIRIVSFAELLAHHLQENTPTPLEEISSLCKLSSVDQEEIVHEIKKQFKEISDALGMDSDGIIKQEQEITTPDTKIFVVSERKKEKTQLSNKLRNYILISETDSLFINQDENIDIYETIVKLACLLFNFKDAIIFATDKSGRFLKGVPLGENRQHLADFSISLDDTSNTVSEALLHKKLTFINSENKQLQVIEEQLQRILDTKFMICIPFYEKEMNIGVLVGSIDPKQFPAIRKRSDFLHEFATQVTYTIKTVVNKRNSLNQQKVTNSNETLEKTRQVVHEVNNPLTIIKNYLNILNNKVAKKESIGAELLILKEEIDRVSNLINGLTRSKSESNEHVTEINSTVNAIVRLFLNSGFVPPSIEICIHNSDQLHKVNCSQQILKQILMNLIKNSVEAMHEGGKIEISCIDYINLDGKKYAGLLVIDNGPGINDEIMNKIFSPAQSTKNDINRGLGLGIVYDLIIKIHGHISCRSNKKGTTFEILLPIPNAK